MRVSFDHVAREVVGLWRKWNVTLYLNIWKDITE